MKFFCLKVFALVPPPHLHNQFLPLPWRPLLFLQGLNVRCSSGRGDGGAHEEQKRRCSSILTTNLQPRTQTWKESDTPPPAGMVILRPDVCVCVCVCASEIHDKSQHRQKSAALRFFVFFQSGGVGPGGSWREKREDKKEDEKRECEEMNNGRKQTEKGEDYDQK